MRNHLLSVFAVLAAMFMAQNAFSGTPELLKNVPSYSTVCAVFDTSAILQLQAVKDARASDPELEKQFQELESKLALRKLSISDMVSGLVIFSERQGEGMGMLAETKMSEADLEALLNGEIFNSPRSDYEVATVAGRKTYLLKGGSGPLFAPGKQLPAGGYVGDMLDKSKDGTTRVVALTFLDKNTLLFSNVQYYESCLSAKKGLDPALLAHAAMVDCSTAPVWAVMGLAPAADGQRAQMPAFAGKLKSVAFSAGSKPLAREDLLLRGSLECVDPAAAAFVASQMQQMVFAMMFAAGKDAQSPVPELLGSLVLDNKEQYVTVSLSVSKSLFEKLCRKAPSTRQPLGAPSLDSAPKTAPATVQP